MKYNLNLKILCYYLNSDLFKTMKAVRTTTKEQTKTREVALLLLPEGSPSELDQVEP